MTEDYLEHYGKKGMKWGVRKARSANKRRLDSAARARKAEGQIATNISKAGSVAKTKISALNTPRNRKVVAAGAAFVGGILKTAGRKALTSYARQEFMGQLVKARPPTGT
jgi:hypothetical protein